MSSPTFSTARNSSVTEQPYIPTQHIRTKINAFAQRADLFADQFFASEKNSEPTTVHHHHHYHSYSPFYSPYYSSWWYQPSVIFVGDRRSTRHDNDDTGAKIFLSIIATIGALVASYAIGLAWSSLSEASDELNQTKEFERNLAYYQHAASPEDQLLLAEAREAVSLKERICKRITNSAAWDLGLRIATAAGLALTAVGAALIPVAAPSLAVGLTLTVVSLAAMLFKWGLESGNSANIRDAQLLKGTLEHLKSV